MTRFDLAAVIVNFNTPELTARAAASLLDARDGLRLQILVIDNGSTRGDLAAALAPVRERLDRDPELAEAVAWEVIRSERNLGFSGGNNLGLARLKGGTPPPILLLNSDAEVRPGCLAKCVAWLRDHPADGVLGPKLLNPDGARQLSCRRFPSFQAALFNRYSLATRLFPNNRWSKRYLMSDIPEDETEPRAVDWVSGAAMVISPEAFEEIGPLDDDFFMYAEDVDYCLRARRAGFEVRYLPEAEVVHGIGKSSRQVPFRSIWWRHRSMWIFYYKHYSRGVAFFDLLTLAGIGGRAALKTLTEILSRATGRRGAPDAS
jgi:N-acetylglucosaminyl-diphospho-decaprenol L-rhamnosyltransferase